MKAILNYLKRGKVISFYGLISLCCIALSGCKSDHNDDPNLVEKIISVPEGLTSDQLNQDAYSFFNPGEYDKVKAYCYKSLSITPGNPGACYGLSIVYITEENWPKAIEYGEKCNEAGEKFPASYSNLFKCYYGAGRWSDAINIAKKAIQIDPNIDFQKELLRARKMEREQSRSITMVIILLIILILAFIYTILLSARIDIKLNNENINIPIIEVIVLSASVSYLSWLSFFSLADWIRSFSAYVSKADVSPITSAYIFERDGYESYALFIMVIANISITIFLSSLFIRLRKNKDIYKVIIAGMIIVSAIYFFQIGFFPPFAEGSVIFKSNNLLVPIILILIAFGFYIINDKYGKYTLWLLIPVLGFISFLPFLVISPDDLAFVFAPALRLLHGAKISDIYFEYDIFLSFLALIWMKLNLSLALFPVLGQLSFLLLFLSLFWFANSFFLNKGLAVFLVFAVIIARFYGSMEDYFIFPATPLRLDLWMILILIAFKKGYNHWSVGLTLALLFMFHRSLGTVYLISYLIFITAIAIFGIADLIKEKKLNFKSIYTLILGQIRNSLVNLIIIIVSLIICQIFLGGIVSQSALAHAKYGFGFLPISPISFYWYIPILLSSTVLLISYLRSKIPANYFSISLLIVALALGNSMYFFGRSHENNILVISTSLILVLFIFFDLIIYKSSFYFKSISSNSKSSPKKSKNIINYKSKIAWILPVVFIFVSAYYYSDRISTRIGAQVTNFKKSQYSMPFNYIPIDYDVVKRETNNSSKVFFLHWSYDFYYYYYGHYTPVGYNNPLGSWIFKKDLEKSLQPLLDQHYYLVMNSNNFGEFADILSHLHYNHLVDRDNVTVISQEDVNLLLPKSESIMHVGFTDSIGKPGIDNSPIELSNNFTIQLILKPADNQVESATIASNFQHVDEMNKGFSIQQNKGVKGEYYFRFGNGKSILNSTFFHLADNVWNYVTIMMENNALKIFNNGELVSNNLFNDKPIINSESTFMIGNSNQGNRRFAGLIKEIKIENKLISAFEIQSTWKSISKSLLEKP